LPVPGGGFNAAVIFTGNRFGAFDVLTAGSAYACGTGSFNQLGGAVSGISARISGNRTAATMRGDRRMSATLKVRTCETC
jgi:hypothetical protein